MQRFTSSSYVCRRSVALTDALGVSAVVTGIRGAFVAVGPQTAIHQRKRNSDDGTEAALFFIPKIAL
jgi:hypothetical protein